MNKKQQKNKLIKRVTVGFTDSEYTEILTESNAKNITVSRLIHDRFCTPVGAQKQVTDEQLNHILDVIDSDEINRLSRSIYELGNNVNQLQHKLNSADLTHDELLNYQRLIMQLWDLLNPTINQLKRLNKGVDSLCQQLM
ncbi:hypothetical protein [Limosilactobacillus reuteri]|uniref:hypothetical protein n=1 Tax=Limosilactobacillus reuteri TaxID=1598 RepID=UPI00399047AF